MSIRVRLATLLAIALLAAACGSDSETDTAASGSDSASASASASGSGSASASEPAEDDAMEDEEAMEDDAMEDEDAMEDDAMEDDCSGNYTFESYSGPADIPRNPEKIAVFDLGMLTSFSELGIPIDAEDGFASLGTPLPAEVEAVASVPQSLGTAFEPDLEALNAMEPDLIVLASRSSRLYPDIVDLDIAPVVDLTSFDEAGTDFFEEFARTHRHIGEIFCVQDEVESMIDDLQGQIDSINAAAPAAGDALVLVTTGAEVGAFGPGAFRFGQVFDTYGFTAADDSLARDETHGEPVSYEFIAEAEPEILFVVDRAAATGQEGESAEAILDNALVNATPAAENDKIFYVDSFDWYIVFNGILGVQGFADDLAAAVGG
ncbi:MAG: ABC transporter substrate-binding protein [Actinomycetota bacterium]